MRIALIFTAALVASAALSHQGVSNPVVMARMDLMSEIGKASKTLSTMAKGTRAFDASEAQAARAALIRGADFTPKLFEAEERDPKDEARDEIWVTFDDFTAKAAAMGSAADALDVTTLASLQAGLPTVFATCAACHDRYTD